MNRLHPLVPLLAAAIMLCMSTGAAAQKCQPGWRPDFPTNDLFGPVLVSALLDDGSGPAVYAGGTFSLYGGGPVVNFVKWTSAGWAPLGGAVTATPQSGEVKAMTVFDDGTGPALYIGGQIGIAGGVPVFNIARWNGTTWSNVGQGISGEVRALAVFNDGSGPALYAAGDFTMAGPITANHIAKWSNGAWSTVGLGTNNIVRSLLPADLDGGHYLYASGDFTTAGGSSADHIARWNGTTWAPVGGGLTGTSITVRTLAVFNDGSGPALYAGGNFLIPQPFGEPSISGLAKWSGGWSPVGNGIGGGGGFGINGGVYGLTVFNDGSGARLYACGQFQPTPALFTNVSGWNGTSWTAMNAGTTNEFAYSVGAVSVGGSPRLLVGGSFTAAGPVRSNGVCPWTGTAWAPLGNGGDSIVHSLLATQEGGQPVLYAGGEFTSVGSTVAQRIARWNGTQWSALGAGVGGGSANSPSAQAIVKFDDGTGEALYVGGAFLNAGGQTVNNIAKWNGTTWSPLGLGMNNPVLALVVFNDGTGPALYAGGSFTTAGTTSAQNIARWNGTTWSRLSNPGLNNAVNALAVFDDGSGPALYAGGRFTTAGSIAANRIAKWNGSTWTALGDGFNNDVNAIAVYNDGFVPRLFAGGQFITSGVIGVSSIARWGASAWEPVSTGIGGPVHSMAVFDEGSGPALYACGNFGSAGAVPAAYIVRWNGLTLSALGTGAGNVSYAVAAQTASPRGLYVGGLFRTAGNQSAGSIAVWGGCPPCYPNCDQSSVPPVLNANDFICFLNQFATGNPRANCDGSNIPPYLTANDFVCFLNSYSTGCP